MKGTPNTSGARRLEAYPFALAVLFALAVADGVALWYRNLEASPVLPRAPAVVLPSPNGYNLYVEASRAAVEPPLTAGISEIGLTRPTTADAAVIASDAPGFRLLRQGLALPVVVPPLDLNGPDRAPASLRHFARTLSVKARVEESQGRWDDAVRTCLDAVQFGETQSNGGGVIERLVGLACTAIDRHPAWSALDDVTAPTAAAAARRLLTIDAQRSPLRGIYTVEKYRDLASMAELMGGSNWRGALVDLFNPGPSTDPLAARALKRMRFMSKQQVIDLVAQLDDRKIAGTALPYTPGALPYRPDDPMDQTLALPFVGNMKLRDTLDSTENRLLATSFALRAYWLAHRAYPTSLTQLCPAYLPGVPGDPFDKDRPLKYRLSGSKYVLYSVGPDGVDDGGQRLPPVNVWWAQPNPKGDIVAGMNR